MNVTITHLASHIMNAYVLSGFLWVPFFSCRSFEPLDIVIRALQAIKPCSPCNCDWIVHYLDLICLPVDSALALIIWLRGGRVGGITHSRGYISHIYEEVGIETCQAIIQVPALNGRRSFS